VTLPNGGETVVFTVETTADDSYGTPTLVPGGSPVSVAGCWVYPISSEEAQALGELVNTVYAVLAADLPGGAFSSVEWDGRFWEPLGEPLRYRSGFTGTVVMTVYMKARGPKAVA
jgi:hypothetical protein